MFSTLPNTSFNFSFKFILSSRNPFNMLKMLHLVKSHLSKARLNIKVTFFKNMGITGELVFYKHNLFMRLSGMSSGMENDAERVFHSR